MAEKRMFSKKIIDTDWFMDMPASSQNLYFHLSMRADDDGFVASPKRIIRLVGASDDDYRLLVAKKFIIPFDSGVCVITDWRINNYLRVDRHSDTVYIEEKKSLSIDENGRYVAGIPAVYPEYTLSKSNSKTNSDTIGLEEDKVEKENKEIKHKYGKYSNVLLKDSEVNSLVKKYGKEKAEAIIEYCSERFELKKYKYNSHYLAILRWVAKAYEEDMEPESTDKQSENLLDMANRIDSIIDEIK